MKLCSKCHKNEAEEGYPLCGDCLEKYWTFCEICEEFRPPEQFKEDGMCEVCYDEGKWDYCSVCGHPAKMEDENYLCNGPVCDSCLNSDFLDTKVDDIGCRNYYYTKNPDY